MGLDLIGREIGTYRILSLLGAGGMGEVYRARDTKLQRDVAIKVLPREVTADPERVARFRREARALAALNHPHVGAIYGFEEVDGVSFLVLELIDGPTLAERIKKGPLTLAEVLSIARQLAAALDAAHQAGIVHRDLKPANVKLASGAQVKVLDFGIAKVEPHASGDTETLLRSTVATEEGAIIGTPAYMSPEQVRGLPVDKRTDIWAFGCVVYEMLAGRPVFDRATFPDTVAAIVEREPDWSALPTDLSPTLNRYLRRCLQRDPRERIHDIADVRLALEGAFDGPLGDSNHSPKRYRSLTAIAAIVLLGVAVSFATLYLRRDGAERVVTRFEIPTPPTSDPVSFALSADGRQLAFVATAEGTPRIFVRPLDQVTAQPLAGTEGGRYPFWAPDGRAIGFFADGKLKRIDLGSNVSQILADAPTGRGGTWNLDGVVVFAPDGGGSLMRVMAAGGTPVPVTQLPSSGGSHRFPQFLPDGRHFLFLFFGWTGKGDEQAMYVGSLDGTEAKRVRSATSAAVYAEPSSLLWVEEGVLVAQPFDPAHAVVSGEPIPVVQEVGLDEGVYRGAFAVSATGVLAHRTGRGERRQLTWVDRGGIVRGTVGMPDEAGLSGVELAPDGKRVAVMRTVQGNLDVWLIDTSRDGSSRRLTFDPGGDSGMVWSSDGTRVVFGSGRNGLVNLFEKAASGAGDDRPLLASEEPKLALDSSRDGQWLLYNSRHPKTGLDIWAAPTASDRKPVPVVQTSFEETAGQFSPDGRWVAYQSNESRPVQIYIRPFPGPGGPLQLTTAGGTQPRWSSDGKELFYVGLDGRLMAVPIAVRPDRQLEAATPVELFRTRLATGPNINSGGLGTSAQYAVASDGRFLMNVTVDAATPTPITVVLNWDAALKK